ncbi:uncharacterized protein BJ171DRAFT_624797 [Polychytrium aggregatum]|uniref:uncharacterized protein n=1 Tax=Polychytrium aggregatum TaxID=110093 RepID=UPI0022FEA988|nr:uncharacterized protein BJ171DRAFT_624797 [Polychytrium aggregatum]KAI9203101.1 hypothetical protein BJ171DRAFT_624797 [Polychytrium aggregatum]
MDSTVVCTLDGLLYQPSTLIKVKARFGAAAAIIDTATMRPLATTKDGLVCLEGGGTYTVVDSLRMMEAQIGKTASLDELVLKASPIGFNPKGRRASDWSLTISTEKAKLGSGTRRTSDGSFALGSNRVEVVSESNLNKKEPHARAKSYDQIRKPSESSSFSNLLAQIRTRKRGGSTPVDKAIPELAPIDTSVVVKNDDALSEADEVSLVDFLGGPSTSQPSSARQASLPTSPIALGASLSASTTTDYLKNIPESPRSLSPSVSSNTLPRMATHNKRTSFQTQAPGFKAENGLFIAISKAQFSKHMLPQMSDIACTLTYVHDDQTLQPVWVALTDYMIYAYRDRVCAAFDAVVKLFDISSEGAMAFADIATSPCSFTVVSKRSKAYQFFTDSSTEALAWVGAINTASSNIAVVFEELKEFEPDKATISDAYSIEHHKLIAGMRNVNVVKKSAAASIESRSLQESQLAAQEDQPPAWEASTMAPLLKQPSFDSAGVSIIRYDAEIEQSGKFSIASATLDKLIEKLADDQPPDLDYIDAFLLTYRHITTPTTLLAKLTERYPL